MPHHPRPCCLSAVVIPPPPSSSTPASNHFCCGREPPRLGCCCYPPPCAFQLRPFCHPPPASCLPSSVVRPSPPALCSPSVVSLESLHLLPPLLQLPSFVAAVVVTIYPLATRISCPLVVSHPLGVAVTRRPSCSNQPHILTVCCHRHHHHHRRHLHLLFFLPIFPGPVSQFGLYSHPPRVFLTLSAAPLFRRRLFWS
jgi:hypothetical protein